MAILTYSGPAGLEGFYAWAQRNAMPPAVPCPTGNVLEILPRLLTRGTYAEAGDTVRFSAFLASGNAVIDFGGQWADNEGVYKRYSRTLEMSAAESPKRLTMPASSGWYRDAAASLRTVGITGQTLYITQELGRNNGTTFHPIAMLAQGWLTSAAPVSDITNHPPTATGTGGGSGCCIATTYSDVVSGNHSNSYTITPGAGQAGRVTYFETNLQTDATVGTRNPYFLIQVGGSSPFFSVPAKTQGASTLYGYAWQIGSTPRDDTDGSVYYDVLPGDLWFSQPFDVRFLVSHDHPGDSVGYATIFYELKGP